MTTTFATIDTPLGPMAGAATDAGLCLLEYTDPRRLASQLEILDRRFGSTPVHGSHRYLTRIQDELRAYFEGRLRTFSVPLVAPGTPFQERVWTTLLQIPFGTTISYEELARRVDAPRGQRAVGLANGMNRIAIVIPCHRVVNKNGKLGGYGGSLWRKQALLDLERTGSFSEGLFGSAAT